ncbi:MAG: U32 family peptidase [Chloroflexota bacterium]
MSNKPELLAPAKNLERLKVAILYGADAVYVGGQKYGLRARADNFTDTELAVGVRFAHKHNAKVYVTLNAFLHDEDFDGLPSYCGFLQEIGVDAVIVSDLGVMRVVDQSSELPIHLSTQASCLNVYAARLWKSLGAKRLILGRELTIAEAGRIRREAEIDVELFIHGAMCMSYSGHCTISNFTAGRDSNRGGCSQSCRFPYAVQEGEPTGKITDVPSISRPAESQNGTSHLRAANDSHVKEEHSQDGIYSAPFENRSLGYPVEAADNSIFQSDRSIEDDLVTFMSSRDLWGIHQIEEFFSEGICSVKIEGRMKSSFYAATTCQAYRQLLDGYERSSLDQALVDQTAKRLQSVPHRDYFAGSLNEPANADSVFGRLEGTNVGTHKYLGLVLDTTPEQLIVRIFAPLTVGDTIEWMPFAQPPITHQVEELYTITNQPIDTMRQDSVVCLPRSEKLAAVERFNVLCAPHQ